MTPLRDGGGLPGQHVNTSNQCSTIAESQHVHSRQIIFSREGAWDAAGKTTVTAGAPSRADKRRDPSHGERTAPALSPVFLAELQSVLMPAVIVVAAFLAKVLYFGFFSTSAIPSSFCLGLGTAAAVATALVANQIELHSTPAIVRFDMQISKLAATVSLAFLLLLCLLYLLKMSDQTSRGWLATWYALSLVLFVATRGAILIWARVLKAEQRFVEKVAVYGSPSLAERVVPLLQKEDGQVTVTGVFSDEAAGAPGGMRVDGGMQELIASAQETACHRVVLAFEANAHDSLRSAVSRLETLPIDVQFSPGAMVLPNDLSAGEHNNGLVLLDIQHRPMNVRASLIKSAMDYSIGATALVLLTPIMLFVAAAIKLDSSGPVFFIQSRHGYNHRIIRIVKFRTMTVAEDGVDIRQAVRGDHRITRVGAFLRSTSLDELPQLFNVVRGELSLVGPRPHAVIHNNWYAEKLARYSCRHKVKPGITGLAQIRGCRGETSTPEAMQKRLEFDLEYIKNWSPWLDLAILARTAFVPFFDRSAY
jgi:Undecaprenyl-phosphate glucose phosphotransferase